MSQNDSLDITRILKDWNDGQESARDELLPFVYGELKKQAVGMMTAERQGHTLQPTALVHEVFLKLSRQAGIEWKDRSHFYGIAARLMRQILIDHARSHATVKRGNRPLHFSLNDLEIPAEERPELLLVLDEVLERLEKLDPQQASIVEMRFFGGMSNSEIAENLKISERTIGRDWLAARLWLSRELNR